MSWILGIRRKGRKKMAKFISLFAGVGGFDLGMEQAGHECVAQVEWDKNAAGVLKHRWPNVPLFCDVSKVTAEDLPDADFITYGFPCQDLSVAGKRKGLDGKRSGLFYEACRIIKQLAERAIRRGGAGGNRFIALAENVKGLLSSGDGYDFARCIRELHNIGASEVGCSVLDSQFFGVPQRRKRVFLVADFGGESTSEILAFSEGVSGHPAPSREAGKGTAGNAGEGVGEGGHKLELPEVCATITGELAKHTNNQMVQNAESFFIPKAIPIHDMATRHAGKRGEKSDGKGNGLGVGQEGDPSPTLTKGDHHAVVSWNGDTTPKASEDVSVTLRSQQGGEGVGVAFHASQDPIHSEEHTPALGSNATIGVAFTASDRSNKAAWEGDISGTINCQMNSESSNLQMGVRENLTVRRLTPIECERLQGFPDNWTAEKMELILEGNEWKATGKVVKQADGPRYRQQGNAVTVNVAEWIGKQIGKVIL
jgi:DNA (cytosine-5)-methyltransferase 1